MTHDSHPPQQPDDDAHRATADLVAYLDGELSPQDRARVEARLATDEQARVELDLLRRADAALDHLPGLAASDGFGARVLAEAQADAADRLTRGSKLRLLRPSTLAAAAAVLLAIGFWWVVGQGAGPVDDDEVVLTAREEREIAADLLVLSMLDALQNNDTDELIGIADDLDVLDELGADDPLALAGRDGR